MLKSTESISLLFVAGEPETAERLISCIRVRGPAVRAQQASDQPELEALLLAQRFHVIILMNTGGGPELAAIHAALLGAGRVTPVVVISDRDENDRVADYESGAFAVVGKDMEDLAALLVLKAAEFNLCATQMHQLRNSLQEAERRYLSVLEDSKDPVVYYPGWSLPVCQPGLARAFPARLRRGRRRAPTRRFRDPGAARAVATVAGGPRARSRSSWRTPSDDAAYDHGPAVRNRPRVHRRDDQRRKLHRHPDGHPGPRR